MKIAAACLGAALVAGCAASAVNAAPAPQSIQVSPIRAVVVVDESGSLDEPAVANERRAAALLALGELAPESQFAVIGFGSSNGPGQNAISSYCGFITLRDRVARERVAACANKVRRRTRGEGDDTDHAAALAQAVSQLANTPASMIPVIFLMTDGVLDVSQSPQYGKTAGERNAQALRDIRQQILPAAKRSRIQIWPLGFGAIDSSSLALFARGGAGSNSRCAGTRGAKPSAVVVGNSTEVVFGLLQTLGRARCAQVEPPTSARLESGKTVTLKIRIPVIATDGAITVTKVDPSFRVSYFDPKGNQAPARGTLGGQTFELAGTSNTVEALRIRDPIPGTWKVEVTDPAGRPGQTITATAIWQGALQGAISIVPGAPVPLRPAVLRVSLRTRHGLIRDETALAGVRATASVAGNFGTLRVPLRDDGSPPDDRPHDGVFAGRLTLPKGAKGNVTAIGRIAGAGLASDERPYYFRVGGPLIPEVVIALTADDAVEPGASIAGEVDITNNGPPQRGSVQLVEVTNDAQVTVSPSSVVMATGHTVTPFRVTFASTTPKRPTTFTVRVTDARGASLATAPTSVAVTTPPGLLARYWWLAPVAFALVGAAVAGARWRRKQRQRAAQVRGLIAALIHRGEEVSTLSAPLSGTDFLIEVVDDDPPRLRLGTNGSAPLRIRRAPAGFALDGVNVEADVHGFGSEIALDERLTMVVRDLRDVRGGGGVAAPSVPTGGGLVGAAEPADDVDNTLL
jgi:hypothetical protein